MIARRHNWLVAINDALDAASNREFHWGGWDCCHFVGDVVLAMTGVDALVDYRGKYEDEASAWAILRERDGNLRRACRRVFGTCVKASFAKRGDVVLRRGGQAIGICLGAQAVFASDDGDGLVFVPMTGCSYAFPLGWPEVQPGG